MFKLMSAMNEPYSGSSTRICVRQSIVFAVEIEPEGRALEQIKDRGYADKYRLAGQPIHLIGVEFSREQRRVVGFEVESIAGA